MNTFITETNSTFLKTALVAVIFGFSLFAASNADAADSATLRAKNLSHPTSLYSTDNNYDSAVRAEPSDSLSFRIIYSSATAATTFNLTLPVDLTFADNVVKVSGTAVTTQTSGQTVTFTFSASTFQVITFNATVASGATLSTNHTLTLNYTADGAPASSDNTTIKTGPVLKTINGGTSASGGDFTATNLTLTGHGFTQVSNITSLTLSDSTNIVQSLSVTGPDASGYYTITGARVPSGKTLGTYYVILSTTVDGNVLTTEANTGETVTYSVTDGTAPLMTAANSYIHSSGVLTLTFNETIDVSATILSKITLYDASSGGTLSQVLTGATVSTADSTTVTIALTQAQKNAVSAAGVSASNLYVQIVGSGIFDLTANALVAQGSRTAFATWTKDTVQPGATVSYTQNGAATSSVKAGSVTITATFSEPISTTPNIAIDQPGTTDIAATAMTGSDTAWTYTYTLNATADGTATVILSNAPDYANNALSTVTGNTFTLDTLPPSPAISTLAAPTNTPTEIALTWTPTYTESDFSTYKIYYGTSSGVTNSNGTLVSVVGSATASYSLTSLSPATTYYFVIYICDQAGNCSTKSNEVSRATSSNAAIIPPSGGSVGGTAPSAPSVASSSGTVSSTGGSITTTLPGGSSATVSVPANTFSSSASLIVSEATATEKQAAPIATSAGIIVGNTLFNIQASVSGATVTNFTNPITLVFTYDPGQLGAIDLATLRVAYFDTKTNTWVALASTVDPQSRKVTAQTDHFTLFALVSFANLPSPRQEEPTPAPTEPTSESGQILGSSMGVYPNGTLLKSPDSPAIWFISEGQKHVILSRPIFDTRFNMADVVRLPSGRQLDLYTQGAPVKFAANTLVKAQGKPDVYRVSVTQGLQPIISMDVFLKRAYRVSDIIEVEPSFLASYQREAYITEPGYIYSGELVAVPQKGILAPVYYIDNGQAREIPNRDILGRYAFKLKQVRAITVTELKNFSLTKAMPYPDGTLLKGKGPTIYFISDGKKHAFHSGLDLDALLYNRKRIKQVTDSVLASFPDASQIRLVQKNIHTASN